MSTTSPTKGQLLAKEAADAAERRNVETHPDVVALGVERIRARVDRFIWGGMITGLLFTMTNVQTFAAQATGAENGSLGWWAAWLLDPTVSVILLGVLIAERTVSIWRVPMGKWGRIAKWSLLAATYLMNTWGSYQSHSIAGIVLHSVPPLVVFMGAEALPEVNGKLTEAVEVARRNAMERARANAQRERLPEIPEEEEAERTAADVRNYGDDRELTALSVTSEPSPERSLVLRPERSDPRERNGNGKLLGGGE